MSRRQRVWRVRSTALALTGLMVTAAGLAAVPAPSSADVTSVTGGAYNYYTDVSLFGGPSMRRGQGQVICSAANTPPGCVPAGEAVEAASPAVTCPAGGGNVSVADPGGAKASYGPTVIFGGKQPADPSVDPLSGPLTSSVDCSLGASGLVTASTEVSLMGTGSPYPGGIGPGPFIADRVQSACTASETGVTGSTSIENGVLETRYDPTTGDPILTEPVPASPMPNYTRTGTIDFVGDSYRIVFNEQIANPDGSITVNAAHEYLLGPIAVGDMVIGSSHCGVTGSPPLCTPAPREGYWLVASDGGIFAYCDAGFFGSTGGTRLNRPIVGMAATPSAQGYWLVASDGGIFAFGDAVFRGSTGGTHLNSPIVGMAATASGGGYWLVAADGGIFAFGDAVFQGSAGGSPLNRPIVGMAATPSGNGYWLVASDGGIFAYGDALFRGSAGGSPLNRPIVGMASTPSGAGYWLVASDGGIFNYGDATFRGSAGGSPLNRPIVGMAAAPDGSGYWLVASDGGIFAYGVGFYGSTGSMPLNRPIVGMAVPRA